MGECIWGLVAGLRPLYRFDIGDALTEYALEGGQLGSLRRVVCF
jgi:hypothetical protein